MSSLTAHYRAHTNIALIKYWGKRNADLFLPITSSLSLTLDAFYTDTKITFSSDIQQDTFYLNHALQDAQNTQKITQFVNLFRQVAQVDLPFCIESVNHVPTAAGLASSASAFAALACACNHALQLNLDSQTLSTYARQGSGSACRSLFGGFVEWHKGVGDDSASSFAEAIDAANWDIAMLVVAINTHSKKISSRIGMQQTIETSPFYAAWPSEVEKDLVAIKQAIAAQDFCTMGEIAEHNAMKMHATMIAAKPSFTYWEPDSLIAMNCVRELRQQGIPCYFTMDAGPNVKVLCRASQALDVQAYFAQHFAKEQLIIAKAGPAPYALDGSFAK
ncbi:MAG: diphosphomevalonate decarboxylase [Aerococcaceae bacterium]|nr:diphosphomevalonate decarboxylase [Aerococcaceae bacterium]